MCGIYAEPEASYAQLQPRHPHQNIYDERDFLKMVRAGTVLIANLSTEMKFFQTPAPNFDAIFKLRDFHRLTVRN
jgi:hypothetical protein